MSNSALRHRAAARSAPSCAMAKLISSAMPVAADPAPRNRKRCSASFPAVRRKAPKIPASATPAVPWVPSMKVPTFSPSPATLAAPAPAGAEIAETENAGAIGGDDEAHVLFRPVAEQLLEPTARGGRQIHAARPAKDVGELLARLPDRGRIHERHVRGRVRHQDRVVERLIARLQIRENEVFLQIVLEGGDLGVPARHLQRHRGNGRRQQAFETQGAALRLGESGAFVEARIAQQIVAGGMSRHRCGRLDRSVRRHLKGSIRGCPLPFPNEDALAAMNADGACDQGRRPREKMNKYVRSSRPAKITPAQRFPYGPVMIDFARSGPATRTSDGLWSDPA